MEKFLKFLWFVFAFVALMGLAKSDHVVFLQTCLIISSISILNKG